MRTLLPLAFTTFGLAAQERPVLIEHVRVFDGQKVVEADGVLLQGGRIQAVGHGLTAPEGATRVEGRGCTLLPGLIDAHVHTWGEALRQAPPFGVTTVLDMFALPSSVPGLRKEGDPGVADIRSAGYLATVPGGHGTEYGLAVPTLTKPEEAQAWVDARVAEGSAYIKIVIEHGSPKDPLPTLSAETVAALVKAAHRRGKLAVAHISTQAEAIEALEAGVDGLVHLFLDQAPSEAFLRLARRKGVFVVPTLSVCASAASLHVGDELMTDGRLKGQLSATQRETLGRMLAWGDGVKYEYAEQATAALERAGVPVLAGTDAPNPGTAFGVSMHGELARLVHAGLTPVQALAAATSRPAATFHLEDRGRIQPGLRADLVLVKGDPTQDILASRAIEGVWRGGLPVDLEARRKQVAAEATAAPALQVADLGVAIGGDGGWNPSTDTIVGGHSKAELLPAAEGATGLEVKGEVVAGAAFVWSGAVRFPGGAPYQPVDVSAFKTLRLKVRGEGSVNLQLYTRAGGYIPYARVVTLKKEGATVRLDLTALKGLDLAHLTAVSLARGPELGPVHFWIEEAIFER